MSDGIEYDCECDRPLVATELADWMIGHPTIVYCDKCGTVFGYIGEYEP